MSTTDLMSEVSRLRVELRNSHYKNSQLYSQLRTLDYLKPLLKVDTKDILEWLSVRKKLLELEVAKKTLIIDALERNDYSLISETLMKELKTIES